jgi:hypothetical protein
MPSADRERIPGTPQEYLSFAELAESRKMTWFTWQCVEPSPCAVAAEISDFAPRGKKGKKVVSAKNGLPN